MIFENVYEKDQKINLKEILEWAVNYGNKIKHYICDTSELLDTAANDNKKILFEAQLGALRDIFFGIYPFTTSSSVLSTIAMVC